jgi:signal transduction histidine kinase/ligand-binding sensor domain-containing protein
VRSRPADPPDAASPFRSTCRAPARLLLLTFLFGLYPAAGARVQIDEPYFESVAGSHEIANGVATALAQDGSGFLWIGTPEGLYRFDGYRMRQFLNDPDDPLSLGHNYIRDLQPLPDGRLVVATQGGGLSVFDPDLESFTQYRHDPADPTSLSSDAILTLAVDPGGGLWVGTILGGLDYWEPDSGRFTHQALRPLDASGLDSETVRSLLHDSHGHLWVGTRNGLKRRAAGDPVFERIASDPADPDSMHGQYVYALYESADGRIWVGTQGHGALWIDPDSLLATRLPLQPEPDGVGHPWVGGFVEARVNELWLVTFGAGIDVLDLRSNRIVRRLRHDPAVTGTLAMDRVMRPLRDRSGLLWIGTWGGGLQRHNPAADAFRTIRHSPSREDRLSDPVTLSTLELDDGRIWVGTSGNGIDVIDLAQGRIAGFRPHPTRPGALRDGTIRALARTADGSVWAGTHQSGLHRWLGDDAFRHYPDTLPDARVRRLLASRGGTLLVGTQSGLAEVDPLRESVELLRESEDVRFESPVWSLAEDLQGNLWVGTPTDLLLRRAGEPFLQRLRQGDLVHEGEPAPLVPSAAADLLVDSRGVLWAIGAASLTRLRGWHGDIPVFERFVTSAAGTERGFGSSLVEDAAGRLWTASHVIDTQSGEVHAFGRADGVDVGNFELGAASSTADGLLMFSGTRGLLLIDPPRFRPWDYQPPVVATALDIDGQPQRPTRMRPNLVLEASDRRFSVEFAAFDYSAPELLRYAYRMDGLDSDWIPAGAAFRVATYNNLWPGQYTLRVRGSNRSGEWSPNELMMPIRVLPAWWQTRLFAAAMLLLLVVVALGGVSLRTARIRRRAHELALLVEQRTAELTSAKESAENALADLKAAQSQLVASEKMASLGQLVAGVAHEINTPIGIAVTAASHLADQIRSNEAKLDAGTLRAHDVAQWRETTEEGMRLILGSLDRANTLIKSFKQVAVDQSSQQRRRFDLKTFLEEVQFALRPSYRRTAHSFEIDCPMGLELDTYPGALFQIVTNLLGNVLTHAYPDGGTGTMRLKVESEGERVVLRFGDDGVGMSSEVAARAFDPFFTTRRGSGGSGLGLHVVHNLATRVLGGQIELASAPGQGTCVTLRIPRVAPTTQAAAPAESP